MISQAAERCVQSRLLAANGGHCWFHRERAVLIDDVLFFGSVTGRDDGDDRAGDVKLCRYELRTGRSLARRLGHFSVADDHNVPALCYARQGILLAAWQEHGRTDEIQLQTFDLEGEPLRPAVTVKTGAGATYSNLLQPDGGSILYDFHRGVGTNPNYLISSDGGETFHYGGRLIAWEPPLAADPRATGLQGGRPYVLYAQRGNRIHFVVVEDHPCAYDNAIYHGYIEDGVVFNSFGRRAGPLPVGRQPPSYGFENLTRLFCGSADAVPWVCDIAVSEDNTVTVVFSVQRGGGKTRSRLGTGGHDLRYHYARFTGDGRAACKGWDEFEIAHAGTCLYPGEDDYAGLIAINPERPLEVIFSSNHCPLSNNPLISTADGRRHYELFLGRIDPSGRTLTLGALTADSREDNIRPVFGRRYGGGADWLLWMAGSYRSYTDFATDIRGIELEPASVERLLAAPYRARVERLTDSPHMPYEEIEVFRRALHGAAAYLEYGSGGSTLCAAGLGVPLIYSVESDSDHLAEVRAAFAERFAVQGQVLECVHADIGPTGRWGYPVNRDRVEAWPSYALAPWRLVEQHQVMPEVILIDGRFRVACFLVSLMKASPGTLILFDDYAERPQYHLVERHCPIESVHGRLAIFRAPEVRYPERLLDELIPHLTVLD